MVNSPEKQLDLTLAVLAWKKLWIEYSDERLRTKFVWKPTEKLLGELSLDPPPHFTCFAGNYFIFPRNSEGLAVKLFFIGNNNQVAYLGTLLNLVANTVDREREIKRLSLINPAMASKLINAKPETIVRDTLQCKIPADSNELNTQTATRAVQRYLSLQAPKLKQCAIKWLSHEQGIALVQEIRALAEKNVKPATKEEELRATRQDELDEFL